MAWRLAPFVIRGEIDVRTRGKICGEIWLEGVIEPVRLRLTGLPGRDLAGFRFRFARSKDAGGLVRSFEGGTGFASDQAGRPGDFTASRKARMLPAPQAARGSAFPMVNVLYLEWFSETNGRVVIESADLIVEMLEGPAWTMTAENDR